MSYKERTDQEKYKFITSHISDVFREFNIYRKLPRDTLNEICAAVLDVVDDAFGKLESQKNTNIPPYDQ